MHSDGHRPHWVPSWFPEGNSVKYLSGLIQLLIMVLAGAFLLNHLFKGKVSQAAATAAGAS